MKVSYKLDYALKTLLDLALHYQQDLVNISDLAKRLDIPKKFLEQILLELKKSGFVDSKRGKVGGYLLIKPPQKITLAEIIRVIDGPIEPIDCLNANYKGCLNIQNCVFKNIWEKVHTATTQIVDNITLADLVNQHKTAQAIADYNI
jgi:Rrf2 family protein